MKRKIVYIPEMGDLIQGTGGVRKTRLKSVSKGTRGWFRICHFDDKQYNELFLLDIYAKNEQENITPEEKRFLKQLTTYLKERKNDG